MGPTRLFCTLWKIRESCQIPTYSNAFAGLEERTATDPDGVSAIAYVKVDILGSKVYDNSLSSLVREVS
jgi:hypothetical protein